jgi:hypothetical protein
MSNSSVKINNDGIVSWVTILYRPAARMKKGAVKAMEKRLIDGASAEKIACDYLETKGEIFDMKTPELVWFDAAGKGMVLAWKVVVRPEDPEGSWEVFVDAEDKTVLQAEETSLAASGSGKVFKPDPLHSKKVAYGGGYVDNNNADSPQLTAERKDVVLQDITYENGRYSLKGPNCVLWDITGYGGTTDVFPALTTNTFNYTRSMLGFEDVMCYYYVDLSARYMKNLGYWNTGLDGMKIDPHGESDHNAYFRTADNWITMGEDGIDAAEDAGVILHEYCHAMQQNLRGMPIPRSSIGEGNSDYWAASYATTVTPDAWSWDLVSYWFNGATPMDQRSVNASFTYYIYPWNVYTNAPLWSSALMNIWWKLGKATTDKIFLETLCDIDPTPTMPRAAMTFINSDFDLFGGVHRAAILQSFSKYRLVQYIDKLPYSTVDSTWVMDWLNLDRENSFDWTGDNEPDNEYFLHLNSAANLTITTCGPNTSVDTKIAVFQRTSQTPFASNSDATCNGSPSTSSTLSELILPAGDYYIVVDGVGNDMGKYDLSVKFSRDLEVYVGDAAFTQTNIVKPSFYVKNVGSQAISNFTWRYYFTAENGKIPVVETYVNPYPGSTPTIENLGNGYYCIKYTFTGVTLNPGQQTSTVQLGVHFGNNSFWVKTNDFSQPPGTALTLNGNVAVFDGSGSLIYGQVPDNFPAVPATPELQVSMRDQTLGSNQQTQPRFYVQNTGSVALSNLVMKYYFTVEAGKTPVIENYFMSPYCTGTLVNISGNSWCAKVTFSGTLAAGGRIPSSDGLNFGLHYSNWETVWNQGNDFSQPSSGSYVLNGKVAIFNGSNELIYGSTP